MSNLLLYLLPFLLLLLFQSPVLTAGPNMLSIPLLELPVTELESAGDYPMACFTPSLVARYLAPDVNDCLQAIREGILCGDKTKAPMQFTTTTSGFTIPYTWLERSCRIGLMPLHDDSADTFSLADVSDRALEIVGRCTSGPVFKWGGRSLVGPNNQFHVVIIGTPAAAKPDREKPACWFSGNKNTEPPIPVTYGMGWVSGSGP